MRGIPHRRELKLEGRGRSVEAGGSVARTPWESWSEGTQLQKQAGREGASAPFQWVGSALEGGLAMHGWWWAGAWPRATFSLWPQRVTLSEQLNVSGI